MNTVKKPFQVFTHHSASGVTTRVFDTWIEAMEFLAPQIGTMIISGGHVIKTSQSECKYPEDRYFNIVIDVSRDVSVTFEIVGPNVSI